MKRGQIHIETIIVIILALLALVIIAVAFTGGFGQLWSKIMGIGGSIPTTTTLLTDAQTQCNSLCSSNSNTFCTKTFAIKGQEDKSAQKCSDIGVSCPSIICS